MRDTGLLTLNTIRAIQSTIEGNNAGFRATPGTVLRDEQTGRTVFEPPSPVEVPRLMGDLEQDIHAESPVDPLVRMAVIHHQFETIHPFYDGNGRTERILNVLLLVKAGLLDSPILYLSRYINETRPDYYAGLQSVRETGNWEPWLVCRLNGVAVTARHTIEQVEAIGGLLQRHKQAIRAHYRFCSQDLLNNLFRHPYTKAALVEDDLGVSRTTAIRYLDALAHGGILDKHRFGRENVYVNRELADLLMNPPPLDTKPQVVVDDTSADMTPEDGTDAPTTGPSH